MRKYEDYFKSEADGLEISALAVLPDEKPYRGIIQIVHGMCEHKERYLPFMEFLAGQGFVTAIHDHRGHGKSVRDKKDLGYMYGGGSKALLMDLGTLNRKLHEQFPDLPLILLGHSMGSLAVRAFLAEHDDCMDMVILSGSPSKNTMRPLGEGIARLEGKLRGPEHRSRLLEVMAFAPNVKKFRKDPVCKSWVCEDPAVAEAYEKSELCGFTFSDDAYLVLFDLMKKTYDVRSWNCTRPSLPILFLSGADDPCMVNVRKFAKAVQAVRSAGYLDVKGKLYPGLRHEILNGIKKEQVYHDIAVYIKKKGF